MFIVDPLRNLNTSYDTSLKMAYILASLGVEVYTTLGQQLTLTGPSKSVTATASKLTFNGSHEKISIKTSEVMDFGHFEAVHMRKEPPYDMDYLETLWILDQARDRTKILNDPIALQQLNEKLIISEFPEYAAPLCVSADADILLDFAKSSCGGDIVVKPLNLYGGRGVVRLFDSKSMREDLLRETENGLVRRLIQRYEPRISDGEVRAFTVAGHDVHWCLKIPDKNNFLANTRAGSQLAPYNPMAEEVKAVRVMAGKLLEKGVVVAGFDLIQGKVSEINITCPALLDPDRLSLNGIGLAVNLMTQWIRR